MKTCLVNLSLIAGGAVLLSQAFAQSPPQPDDAAATTTLRAPASAPRLPGASLAPTVAANARATLPASVTRTVNAAGSVLILVDGIVASAAMARIHPPAPGFVYER